MYSNTEHFLLASSLKGQRVKCDGVVSQQLHSRLLHNAIDDITQHYIKRLTTVATALKCRRLKRTQFIPTNMSHFVALKHSKNGVCSYTISRLCLFQAVLLLAEHYTMRLTTFVAALRCRRLKRTQFIAINTSHFSALKRSKNGECSYTIWRLCLFQAVLLLAQHYTMRLLHDVILHDAGALHIDRSSSLTTFLRLRYVMQGYETATQKRLMKLQISEQ
jgi:hypothetical protein